MIATTATYQEGVDNHMTETEAEAQGCAPWRWLRRIVLGFVVLILGFLAFTSISTRVVEAQLHAALPEQSRLVDIGGRDIHAYTAGLENPADVAVVFVGCLGCNSGLWQLVQPGVAEEVRTYAFDQAGITWSDPGPRLLPANIADDLGVFLAMLPEDEIVLVTFSAGILPVHDYLLEPHPDAPPVTGLVSVEGSPLDQWMVDLYEDFARNPLGLSDFARTFIIETGIGRLLMPLFAGDKPDVDTDYFEKTWQMQGTRSDIRAWYGQYGQALIDDVRRLVALDPATDLIVVILDPDNAPEAAQFAGNAQMVAEFETQQDIQATQYREWVNSAADGSRVVTVDDSSHNVMYDHPEVIIDSVLELVQTLRTTVARSDAEAGNSTEAD
jgi:pimeloyl-ACP methyl ester carboxylesterase